nr:MAG TPA: hypothetical protein [Caudoviricetes sp.]
MLHSLFKIFTSLPDSRGTYLDTTCYVFIFTCRKLLIHSRYANIIDNRHILAMNS